MAWPKLHGLLSGWGLKYFDYDNDGAVDLILANGHPDDMIDGYSMQVKYKEPLLLFHQGEDGKLHNVSEQAGPAFQRFFPARGLAVGDFDNDGASMCCLQQWRAAFAEEQRGQGKQLAGTEAGGRCNKDAIGAKITWTAGGKKR